MNVKPTQMDVVFSILLFLTIPLYAVADTFSAPQSVPIDNLPLGHGNTPISTEEPFVSRDGRFLFFNSGKTENKKDLHFAEWGDGRWRYRGEIGPRVNTAKEVEGNPTMDAAYNFFYIDSGAKTMVRKSIFNPATGTLGDLHDEEGVPQRVIKPFKHFIGNMGVEVSANGDYLYFSRATWKMNMLKLGPFKDSDILLSRRKNGKYVYDAAEAARIMQNINTPEMEYAASISTDGLELFFTRTSLEEVTKTARLHSQIMRAERTSLDQPFSVPRPIAAIGGNDFVEGPSIGPNDRDLYYHKLEGTKCRLYKVTRMQ